MEGPPEPGEVSNDLRVVIPDAEMEVDFAREELRTIDGERVDVRPQSFQVLRLLALNAGRVVSKTELHDTVWGDSVVTDDSLVQAIHNLREVLGDHDHRMIRTVPRQGYELVAGAVERSDVNVGASEMPADLTGSSSAAEGSHLLTTTGSGTLRRRIVWLAAIAVLSVAGGLTWFQPWQSEEPVSAEVSSLHDKPSIAVLAFDNMTGDPSQEYFSDGVTDDIITSLSRSPWLVVMSRNLSFAYKGKRVQPQQIADELGVLYLLEGSVQKSNDKVRITAQLVDARTGGHVWAEHYDEEGKDVLALQDAVTNKVMHAVGSYVGGQIRKEGTKRAWAKGSTELEEYDYLLRGHSFYFRYTKEDMARAREIFEEGLERFADSSLLKAKLGWTLAEEATWGWSEDPVRDYQRAFGLAQQALANEAAPLLAEAIGHWLLAFLHFNHEADVASALLEQEKTVQLIPGSGMVQADLAWYQNYSGKPGDALESLEIAIRSDPEYPWIPMYRGEALHMTAKNHEAIEALDAFKLDFVPDKYRLLASSYVELDMNDEARAALDKFLELVPKASASLLRDQLIYKDRIFVQRHIENLRKAGLPD